MKARGYTIVELLVVIVVFGVLLSIAYTRLSPALDHARVQRAATVLATDLQYAQMLAVRQREPVALVINESLKGYVIRERDTATVYRQRFFGSGTEFLLDEFTATSPFIEMFPNGVATATTTFTLGLLGYRRQVRVTRAGQVRVIRVP
ncbi:MAG TPA: GspH/FimT family protein [Gemmatimonadales bacterium]|nr:GspH/FimT family protein [Gemmatimonadales bacterium]